LQSLRYRGMLSEGTCFQCADCYLNLCQDPLLPGPFVTNRTFQFFIFFHD